MDVRTNKKKKKRDSRDLHSLDETTDSNANYETKSALARSIEDDAEEKRIKEGGRSEGQGVVPDLREKMKGKALGNSDHGAGEEKSTKMPSAGEKKDLRKLLDRGKSPADSRLEARQVETTSAAKKGDATSSSVRNGSGRPRGVVGDGERRKLARMGLPFNLEKGSLRAKATMVADREIDPRLEIKTTSPENFTRALEIDQ